MVYNCSRPALINLPESKTIEIINTCKGKVHLPKLPSNMLIERIEGKTVTINNETKRFIVEYVKAQEDLHKCLNQ